jgi:hypothetical protein
VGVACHQQDRTRPGGQRRLRDMAYDRLAIQFGYKLGFVWRPAESLRLAGSKDDCCNPPHLRHLLHRATSFAQRRDDFGDDCDADFSRIRGADGKPYGAMDLGELGLGKAGRAHPFEAPCVGYFGAERADIKAFRAQTRAERWVVDPRGIMHLTYPDLDPHIATASPAESGEVGAPEQEIEITQAMIRAGVCVLLAMDTRFESHEDVIKEVIIELFKNNQRGSAYRLKFL